MYNQINKTRSSLIGLLVFAVAVVTGCAADNSDYEANNNSDGPFEPRSLSTEYQDILLTQVVDGLEFPWSIAFLPDERMLVTEKPGRLHIVDGGELVEVSGLPDIQATNQGGLLDVLPHYNFEANNYVYLTYSEPGEDGDTYTALGRGELTGNSLENFEVIFRQDRASSPGRHYGSRLAWSPDGYLFMSIGDRGANPPRAQDLDDHAGTLLRLNDDGSAADNNPFAGQDGALPEIYSYGHRNIQGLYIDQDTGDIWATEHGPRGGDELNFIEPGNNYGWPTATKGRDYGTEDVFPDAEARSLENMTDPVYEFLPTHSPSGLVKVTSEHFPNWEGNLLVGGLRGERIRRVVLDDLEVIHEEELLLKEIGRIRDVRQGPDGYYYVINDGGDAGIYRIEPDE